nr:DNA mismatch repair protein [Tanacetum cinerariifolium]
MSRYVIVVHYNDDRHIKGMILSVCDGGGGGGGVSSMAIDAEFRVMIIGEVVNESKPSKHTLMDEEYDVLDVSPLKVVEDSGKFGE